MNHHIMLACVTAFSIFEKGKEIDKNWMIFNDSIIQQINKKLKR